MLEGTTLSEGPLLSWEKGDYRLGLLSHFQGSSHGSQTQPQGGAENGSTANVTGLSEGLTF